MPTSDRTTKALLAIIALGVWLNVFITAGGLNDIASDVSFLHRWVLSGAPVTVER